jgi:hypothetical protein
MGSPAVAAWFAHAAFWVLLGIGWATGPLTAARAGVALILWLAGAAALGHVAWQPAHAMFPSYVAVLDIALVFLVFKGDVHLT